MGEASDNIIFFQEGLRLDGRQPTELRPLKIEAGVLARADGSCYIEMGGNKVIAAVYGPREVHPRHLQEVTRAIVRYRYNMASFSVEERKRPGPDRRSYELSKVSREALEPVILTSYFPRSVIDVFVEVLQADAGIPMKSMISSCAAGKVGDTLILDPMKEEDNFGQADMPIAMTPSGEITLLQMDGKLTRDEFRQAIELAMKGCREIYEIQRMCLVDKYAQLEVEPFSEVQICD